ncbi:MAG: hypothetical protein LBM93_07555, partial [Oscillospiraceae bacterium]|nr:hypothetical protein [Oscillospiraceae bacterium]
VSLTTPPCYCTAPLPRGEFCLCRSSLTALDFISKSLLNIITIPRTHLLLLPYALTGRNFAEQQR